MGIYRLYYCPENGKKFGVDDLDATTDTGAIERARERVKTKSPLFEVWQGERLVHRQAKAASRTSNV